MPRCLPTNDFLLPLSSELFLVGLFSFITLVDLLVYITLSRLVGIGSARSLSPMVIAFYTFTLGFELEDLTCSDFALYLEILLLLGDVISSSTLYW
jgi:hypothetical protein